MHKSLAGFSKSDESKELMYMIGKLKDFKPQKLNQTPRGLWSDLVKSGFVCNRILSAKELTYDTHTNPFHFTCNKEILLVGFALNTVWCITEYDD